MKITKMSASFGKTIRAEQDFEFNRMDHTVEVTLDEEDDPKEVRNYLMGQVMEFVDADICNMPDAQDVQLKSKVIKKKKKKGLTRVGRS